MAVAAFDSNQRMMSVYLMVALDILLVHQVNSRLNDMKYKTNIYHVILGFIYNIAYLWFIDRYLLNVSGKPNSNIILRSIFWFLFICSMGLSLHNFIRYTDITDEELSEALMITLGIFITFSVYSMMGAPGLVDSGLEAMLPYVIISFLVLSLVRLFNTLNDWWSGRRLKETFGNSSLRKILSSLFILIFVYLVVYNTRDCQMGKTLDTQDILSCSNNLFLDSFNLFREVLELTSGGNDS